MNAEMALFQGCVVFDVPHDFPDGEPVSAKVQCFRLNAERTESRQPRSPFDGAEAHGRRRTRCVASPGVELRRDARHARRWVRWRDDPASESQPNTLKRGLRSTADFVADWRSRLWEILKCSRVDASQEELVQLNSDSRNGLETDSDKRTQEVANDERREQTLTWRSRRELGTGDRTQKAEALGTS